MSVVQNIQKIGRDQYAQHCKDVIIEHICSIHDPIKKNPLLLLSCPHPKKVRQTTLNTDIILFSRLYIVMQHMDSDMNTFFSHENHPFPPSISDGGKLWFGKEIRFT